MPIKCLIACENEFLLGTIVENLLAPITNMELSGIIGTSKSEMVEAIERKKPDVIIFCNNSHNTAPANLVRIIKSYPDIRIVTVTANDNYMHIYGKQKYLMTKSTDLVEFIQNQYVEGADQE